MRHRFEFVAGCLSLDFADTMARRDTEPHDLLRRPEDLRAWLAAAGLGDISGLDRASLATARDLREAISAAASRVVDGKAPADATVARLNAAARRPDLRPRLSDGAVTFTADDPPAAALSRIAADAIMTIGTELRHRVRRCPECGMLFRDNSRPGRRKWCSSASGCGNRAKVRRHRAIARANTMPTPTNQEPEQ